MSTASAFLEFLFKYGASHLIGVGAGGAAQFIFEGVTWAAEQVNSREDEMKQRFWHIYWENRTSPKNHLGGSTYGYWYFKTEAAAWAAYKKFEQNSSISVYTPSGPGT